MANITFSRKSLNRPTPASVAFVINIIMAVSGAVGGWIGTNNFIPAKISTVIQSFLGLLVLLCVALKPFFGVEVTANTVPTEEVKEVEDKPKDKIN